MINLIRKQKSDLLVYRCNILSPSLSLSFAESSFLTFKGKKKNENTVSEMLLMFVHRVAAAYVSFAPEMTLNLQVNLEYVKLTFCLKVCSHVTGHVSDNGLPHLAPVLCRR